MEGGVGGEEGKQTEEAGLAWSESVHLLSPCLEPWTPAAGPAQKWTSPQAKRNL